MTEELLGTLLPRLKRTLRLDVVDDETLELMEDELRDAEGEIMLYLGVKELPDAVFPKVVELAAIFYHRDCAEHPELKSVSYGEGQLSQSETYLNAREYRGMVEELVKTLARYRRVSCS